MRICDWSSDGSSDLSKPSAIVPLSRGTAESLPTFLKKRCADKDIRVTCGFARHCFYLALRPFSAQPAFSEKIASTLRTKKGSGVLRPRRAEERRVGKEGGRTCKSWWSPEH